MQIAPAPWHLTGDAYIMLYKFSKEFIEEHGFLADYQQNSFNGYVGTVMLVNYQTSGVGPYFELLFIPGMFDFKGKNYFSISKIYVSSIDSVYNGIENWGIPKEWAAFDWQDGKVSVSLKGKVFFEATFQDSWLKFPLTTALFPLKVVQKLRNDYILTKPSAKGKAQMSKLTSVKVDAQFFPDLSKAKPLMTMKVKDFKMIFPIAQKLIIDS